MEGGFGAPEGNPKKDPSVCIDAKFAPVLRSSVDRPPNTMSMLILELGKPPPVAVFIALIAPDDEKAEIPAGILFPLLPIIAGDSDIREP